MFYRITQIRSAIGLPDKYYAVLRSLGLGKRGSIVYHNINPAISGQVFKVKELVKVDTVKDRKTRQEIKQDRKPDPGFEVMNSL
ncbi:hypothetical protein CANCADRAFT_26006 [Tortispora caseinolytica NRRL Y-17796]|uniref:Large ribosomal subunit protein uL30m n=1 Tax=Tortispora caseinolytica NRRL Y-17796 TaxID=767744 RepID=A0A1E4TGK4_9ASCO|nr:hypothetical protein CANCADRAFT_26006 [Tortispora caseinolytica NRRL Y-17796]